MRILILGGSGMLGHQLWRQLHKDHEVWVTLRQPVERYAIYDLFENKRVITGIDVANTDALLSAIQASRPEVVINCIGIIKQIKEAKNSLVSISINALLPHRLAQMCAVAGARLIHISTDCVFSGKKGNYTEDDISDAEDLYGRTKYLGELHDKHCITLRTSIIGRELETKSGLIEWFLSQKGKIIKGYKNAIYTGLTTVELARIIEVLLLMHPQLYGLWHVSSDAITKYDLLRLAQNAFLWEGEIVTDENFVCDRSLNSTRFRNSISYSPPTWSEMITELAKISNI
jgi:dTDP-4-dehydrorhamnose reductase